MKFRASFVLAALALSLAITPAHATFPGENGKIVFVGNQSGTWQLYTINPDGSDITQITNLPPTIWETWYPAFSPNGKRIIFGHDTPAHPCGTYSVPSSGCVDLYVVNADGTGLVQLTHDGLSSVARWSPDGGRIVFSHFVPLTGEAVMATMSTDGTDESTTLTSKFWSSSIGTYTPNGMQIVFESQLDGLLSAAWRMNADGSKQRRLTPATLAASPTDVSPDGLHVLLTNNYNTNSTPAFNSALFVAGIDGEHIRQITHVASANENFGTYSPDGKKIVFVSDRLNSFTNYDLFTMDADGSNITRIASGLTVGGCPDENCVGPSWGPKPKK